MGHWTGISWHGKKSAPGWDQRSAGSRRDSKNWLREGFSFLPLSRFFFSLSLSSFPLPARAGGGRKGKGKRNPEGNEEQLRPGRVWRRRVRPRRCSLFPKSPQFGSQILGYPEAGRSVVNKGGGGFEAKRRVPALPRVSRKRENSLWKNNGGNGPENSSPGQVSGGAAPLGSRLDPAWIPL